MRPERELEHRLVPALKKLEAIANKEKNKNGYSQNVRRLKILCELLSEQIDYENTNYPTR